MERGSLGKPRTWGNGDPRINHLRSPRPHRHTLLALKPTSSSPPRRWRERGGGSSAAGMEVGGSPRGRAPETTQVGAALEGQCGRDPELAGPGRGVGGE